MKNSEELRQQLRSINRKSYPAYKGLKGLYHFGNYILSIDHVQGDPFASPSHVSIQISHRDTVSLKNRSVSTAFVQKAPAKAACSLPVIVVRRFFPGQPVK